MEVGINLVIGILVTLLFSAFFSGMEIAFVSSNRMLAEMDKDKNKNGVTQRLVSLFYNHPNGFVSTHARGQQYRPCGVWHTDSAIVRQYNFSWYGCGFHCAC